MSMKYVLYFAILTSGTVRAHYSTETKKSFMEYLHKSIEECAEELSLDLNEFKENYGSTSILDSKFKCIYGCILKKSDAINEEGKLNFDKGLEEVRGFIANDDDYKVVETVVKSCTLVNDEEVSDGVQGCERAVLFVNCIVKLQSA